MYSNDHSFVKLKTKVEEQISIYFVPWLITKFCLISEFYISGCPFENLGRGSWYPTEDFSLDIKISSLDFCSANPRLIFLDQISDFKNLGRGFEDYSTNLDLNPRLDIKILGREFQFSPGSFRCAAAYLKFRYQIRRSN